MYNHVASVYQPSSYLFFALYLLKKVSSRSTSVWLNYPSRFLHLANLKKTFPPSTWFYSVSALSHKKLAWIIWELKFLCKKKNKDDRRPHLRYGETKRDFKVRLSEYKSAVTHGMEKNAVFQHVKTMKERDRLERIWSWLSLGSRTELVSHGGNLNKGEFHVQ